MDVLDTWGVSARVEEEKDGEQGGQARSQQLHVRSLGQTDQVQEVTTSKETELVAEASHGFVLVVCAHIERSNLRVHLILVVAQLRPLVRLHEVHNTLLVLLLNLPLIQDGLTSCLFFKFDLLDRHH